MHKVYVFLTLFTVFYTTNLFSQDLDDKVMSDAVQKTQQMLRESKKRTNQVKALGGSEKDNEEIYGLAADIFGSLAKDQQGDPDKMEKVLQKALTDPEGFANTLSPEQKKKLHDISVKLPGPRQVP